MTHLELTNASEMALTRRVLLVPVSKMESRSLNGIDSSAGLATAPNNALLTSKIASFFQAPGKYLTTVASYYCSCENRLRPGHQLIQHFAAKALVLRTVHLCLSAEDKATLSLAKFCEQVVYLASSVVQSVASAVAN